ncbi:phosphonate ABC transporter substrate-binding protein [Ancylobacter defluvii]|uniref:Phosphonate ABC transporter substrate-binding protein n=1 Tax=Ancylobacter defluvii TaxID=1282440 RepID=A0A9W6JZ35_9HYPH|nr:phosphonate ABC transporter substrate-binding protein [Ancylobacter defluvii]MBS7589375.1 phosphonate ABC transporter substrate-binding protein [Ancylobacter defluvii]GLK84989.1 phosphonate ABC transporter substrate-binding protein [Ancylobacter defluvii]
MKRILAAGLVLAGLTAPLAAQEVKELNFGFISTESSANLAKSFEPLLKDMEKAIGVPVKPFFVGDYAGVIEGMRFKKVDVAWFGNKSAMEAVDRSNGEVFVKTAKPDGSSGYYSLIVTNVDRNDINGLKDILDCSKGYNFGNGDPNSTSGFLVPSYYVFAMNNVDPQKCFKRVVTSNHEGNLLAVANKQVDFATNNTENMSRLQQTRPAEAAKIKEVWRSPMIAGDPIVWRKDLPADLKAKIYTFFMTYGRNGTPEEIERARAVLAKTSDGWGPFLASSDAQLIPIRQLELFKAKMKAQNNDKLSADEKTAEVKKIDAQLADLDSQLKKLPAM